MNCCTETKLNEDMEIGALRSIRVLGMSRQYNEDLSPNVAQPIRRDTQVKNGQCVPRSRHNMSAFIF